MKYLPKHLSAISKKIENYFSDEVPDILIKYYLAPNSLDKILQFAVIPYIKQQLDIFIIRDEYIFLSDGKTNKEHIDWFNNNYLKLVYEISVIFHKKWCKKLDIG